MLALRYTKSVFSVTIRENATMRKIFFLRSLAIAILLVHGSYIKPVVKVLSHPATLQAIETGGGLAVKGLRKVTSLIQRKKSRNTTEIEP